MKALALLLFSPLLFILITWLVGRLVLSVCLIQTKVNEAFAIFVGLALVLAICSNLSFLGFKTDSLIVWLIFVLLSIGLYKRKLVFRHIQVKELAHITFILMTVSLHYLMPNILSNFAPIGLLEAGDYHQYISMGAWLQSHPITAPNNYYSTNLNWNVVDANVSDFQSHQIRLGSTLLLALYGKLFFAEVTQVYSAFAAVSLSLLALSVYLFSSVLLENISNIDFNKNRIAQYIPLIVAILFGLSPTAVWPSLAAFLPQTMGLAFCLSFLSSLCILRNAQLDSKFINKGIFWGDASALWRALLIFAVWAIYPESFPLLALIIGSWLFVTGLSLFKDSLQVLTLKSKGFLAYSIVLIVIFIAISPLHFQYGVLGLAEMMKGAPHGGYMEASVFNILSVLFGLSAMPLSPEVLAQTQNSLLIVPVLVLLIIGLVSMVLKKPSRKVAIAIIISLALIFAFVILKYDIIRTGVLRLISEDEVQIVVNWNKFKAAQFLSPFTFSLALTGLLLMCAKFKKPFVFIVFLFIISTYLYVIFTNDKRYLRDIQTINPISKIAPAIERLQPGRLLIDINGADRYQRYALYSDLVNTAFISTHDAQHPCLRLGNTKTLSEDINIYAGQLLSRSSLALVCKESKFFEEPVSYILTDVLTNYKEFNVISMIGEYAILDAKNKDFIFSTKDVSGPKYYFFNSAHLSSAPMNVNFYNLLGSSAEVIFQDQRYWVNSNDLPYATIKLENTHIDRGIRQFKVNTSAELLQLSTSLNTSSDLKFHKDLLPLISDKNVSTDVNGNKIKINLASEGVKLNLENTGDSRLLIGLNLEPGTYFFKLSSEVSIRKLSEAGFGAYFGRDNDLSKSFEINPSDKPIYYRYVHDGDLNTPVFFSLGIGGWGKASGSILLKEFKLYKE